MTTSATVPCCWNPCFVPWDLRREGPSEPPPSAQAAFFAGFFFWWGPLKDVRTIYVFHFFLENMFSKSGFSFGISTVVVPSGIKIQNFSSDLFGLLSGHVPHRQGTHTRTWAGPCWKAVFQMFGGKFRSESWRIQPGNSLECEIWGNLPATHMDGHQHQQRIWQLSTS